MSERPPSRTLLILDACVLIDWLTADAGVLRLCADCFKAVYVSTAVLDELKSPPDDDDLVRHGILVLQPEMEDAVQAAGKAGALSFADRICFLTAKRHGFTCVTNDARLRNHCAERGVDLFWGLEMLAVAYETGVVSAERAVLAARALKEANPRYTTEKVLQRFLQRIHRP